MTVRAAHVLSGQMPVADQATATIAITNGVLRLDGVSAKLAGGTLSGHASLDASTPPTLAATARLADIVVDGPLTGAPVDLVAGRLDGTVDLTGTGYSPAGLLATLKGGVRLTVRDGTLAGLDAGRVLAVLNTATTAGPAPDAGRDSGRGGGCTARWRHAVHPVDDGWDDDAGDHVDQAAVTSRRRQVRSPPRAR